MALIPRGFGGIPVVGVVGKLLYCLVVEIGVHFAVCYPIRAAGSASTGIVATSP